jgi:hypothetical protein
MFPTSANGKVCYLEMPAAAQGCELAQPIGADAPEITARFRDPGGNVIGLYQEPG